MPPLSHAPITEKGSQPMSLTVTHPADRTQESPARVVSLEERRAGLVNVAAQLEEAFQRGWAECARQHGWHLSAVPAGGAS
jgi:hypothetical protein